MVKLPKLIPQELNGDLRRGGYVLSGYVEGDTDAVSYGQAWQLRGKSGSKFLDPVSRVIFDGHIIAEPDNISVSRYTSRVQVRAGTMQELLMSGDLQAIGFTEQASPANDHQITGLQLADIVQHIFERHCNAWYDATEMPDGVITTATIDTANSVALNRYNVDESNNFWRSLQQIGGGEKAGEFYNVWFNRKNQFYYQPAPAFWGTPPTTKGTIDKTHLRGSIKVKRVANQPRDKVGQVSIRADLDFDTFYTATNPTTPGVGKTLRITQGIYADSQAKANTLAQRLYQWMTRNYTITIEVDPGLILFGDDGDGLDLADKVTLDYTGTVEDAISGAGFHLDLDEDYFVYGVRIQFDPFGKMARGFLTLESDPT